MEVMFASCINLLEYLNHSQVVTYRPSYRTGPVVHNEKEHNRKKKPPNKIGFWCLVSLYVKQNDGELRQGQKTGGGYVQCGWDFRIALSLFPSAIEHFPLTIR